MAPPPAVLGAAKLRNALVMVAVAVAACSYHEHDMPKALVNSLPVAVIHHVGGGTFAPHDGD